MPFLRFSRDKRGYETTSLMHSFRGRGEPRPRLLYWYRTPPDIKVGRAAIDEEAIRALEESNPELTFDWSRILHSHARPQPACPTPGPDREGRAAGAPPRPGEAPRRAGASTAAPPDQARPAQPRAAETASARSRRRRRGSKPIEATRLPFSEETRPDETAPVAEGGVGEAEAVIEEILASPGVDSEPAAGTQGLTRGDAEETAAAPAEMTTRGSALGTIRHEDLARLRARYAEIQARITQRVSDPQRLEKLRTLAEQLNPDGWVTDEEVASSLAEFEAVHSALKAMLGRRRRRSRRGGVRHRRGGGTLRADEKAALPDREPSQHEPGDSARTPDAAGPGGGTRGSGPADSK